MVFFRQSSYKKIIKLLQRHNFTIKQGGNHTKARNNDGVLLIIPRHNKISSGVVKSITEKLINECDIDEKEIERALK